MKIECDRSFVARKSRSKFDTAFFNFGNFWMAFLETSEKTRIFRKSLVFSEIFRFLAVWFLETDGVYGEKFVFVF